MKKYLYILCGLMCLQSALAFDATVFPTLAGLSRTVKYEFSSDGCAGTSPQTQTIQPNKEVTINGKQYLEFTGNIYLREADNKVYIYSGQGTEDLILYDYALGVGEMLKGIKMQETPDGRIFSHSEETALTVTKIELITLLDGKEYKKWTFDNGMEYVETIGMYGEDAWAGDFFLLIQQPIPVCQIGNHLVCVSCNGQPLYETSAGSCDNIDSRLDNTSAATQTVKYLRNGQLFLQLGEQSYDALGRPVSLLNE